MPGEGIVGDEGVDEPVDRLRVGQSEQVAHPWLVELVCRRRQQLVEHRLGVPHAAGGEAGDQVNGFRRGGSTVGVEDPPELAFDLVRRQAPDVEALKARDDRRRELLGMGRREHEDDELGRLLERLQEGVPGVLRDLVGLVEDVDLASKVGRGVVDPLAQVTDGVDPAVRGGIDLDQVHRPALADRRAGLAGIARIAVLEVRAVDRFREDPREARLARAPRPHEQDRVRNAVRPDGVAEGLDDGLLPDDLGERLGSPAAIDRLMRLGGDGFRHVDVVTSSMVLRAHA